MTTSTTGVGVTVAITSNPDLNAFIQTIVNAENNFTTPTGSQSPSEKSF